MLLKKLKLIFRKTILTVIRIYQFILSPDQGIFRINKGTVCRFYPSCSRYSFQAIERFGIIKGGLLSIKRILRCHPFNPGGWDPVPRRVRCKQRAFAKNGIPF